MFQSNLLEGMCGIITGGSSGIGLAMAQFFIQHGAKVSITGRNTKKLEEATQLLGENSFGLCGDVRDSAEIQANLEQHLERFDRLDFLCNNAAGNFLCPLEDMSERAFKSVTEIVTLGTFLWSKAALPIMKEAGEGCIINTSTTYAQGHAAFVGHSGAAKAAVENLTKTMAVEWGPMGIRVNAIAPGPVEGTEGVRRLMGNEKMKAQMTRMMPTPRMAQGWEIGAMAAFLISPLGRYVNGASIPVDGGLHLSIPGLLPVGIPLELPKKPVGAR